MDSFSETEPQKDDVKAELKIEAKQHIRTKAFWKLGRLRKEYVDKRLESAYLGLHNEWTRRKEEHDNEQSNVEEKMSLEYQKEYSEKRDELEGIIVGNTIIIDEEISRWISALQFPFEFKVQYNVSVQDFSTTINISLPSLESIPKEKAYVLASGQVKRKPKTQKELKFDYMCFAYGLAIFSASHVFNISPAIKEIIVSGYEKRRNRKTSAMQKDCVYSIRFTRTLFESTDLKSIDIFDFWESFENISLPTQTYQLKTVVPFENSH